MLATAQPSIGADRISSLSTRNEIPALLNERRLFGCGVEVGVQQGAFSAILLSGWQGSHLISVDPWAEDTTEGYVDIANLPQNGYYQLTQARLRPFGRRSSIWRTTSVEAAKLVPNFSLDFVYLDARHDYASVLEDLDAWIEKVRPGGIIAGHDYIDGDFEAGSFGVKSAVDDFFRARGILVYSTCDDTPWCSWVVEVPHTLPAEPRRREGRIETSDLAEFSRNLGVVQVEISSPRGPSVFKLSLDRRCPIQSEIERALNANVLYAPEAAALIVRALMPGDTFLDIGSDVGYFSFLGGAMVGSEGMVLSIEPRPNRFFGLAQNMGLNSLRNVIPLNLRTSENAADDDGEILTIDEIVHRLSIKALKVIRLDLPPAAQTTLKGAEATLRSLSVPFVMVTVDPAALRAAGGSEVSLRAEMKALGYDAFHMHSGGAEQLPAERTVERSSLILFRHNMAPAL